MQQKCVDDSHDQSWTVLDSTLQEKCGHQATATDVWLDFLCGFEIFLEKWTKNNNYTERNWNGKFKLGNLIEGQGI